MNSLVLFPLALVLTFLAGTGCYGNSVNNSTDLPDEVKSWIEQHIWVPIVVGVVLFVVLICVCCCCCCSKTIIVKGRSYIRFK
ncbi:hypothetical protein ACF0H5_011274 [Mactra antiquata]